jgi:hypothetical protein
MISNVLWDLGGVTSVAAHQDIWLSQKQADDTNCEITICASDGDNHLRKSLQVYNIWDQGEGAKMGM